MPVWSPEVIVQNPTTTVSVDNFPATQPVSGTVAVSNFPATQPVSGTVTATGPLTDTQLRATPVPISGTVSVTAAISAIATVTSVPVSTTVATLSASNPAKTKVIVYNEAGTLFVKFGAGATATSYTYRLTANTVLEITGYTGIVTAIKQTGSTDALVTQVGI